jgi:phosphate transport system permease protein
MATGNIKVRQSSEAHLRRRHAAEKRFKLYGVAAISIAMVALCVLLTSIISKGWTAFGQTHFTLSLTIDPAHADPEGNRSRASLAQGNYTAIIRNALYQIFPDVTSRRDKRQLNRIVSGGADLALREKVMADPSLLGNTISFQVLASDDADMFNKGYIDRDQPEGERKFKNREIAWFDKLKQGGMVSTDFNWRLFSNGASREPELAGIWGALSGSLLTMMVTLLLTFPVGVGTAIYLEEFAPKNRWTDIIEVNINNLAAVPSIVFGLLGLAVFLNFFGFQRSVPLVGGMVLALMTLPTIIIASRAALKAVPPSIREAALGVGASKMQAVFHHVLPLAMPGILTGTIIGMAQALGETAPLLMIGMVAFIVDIPASVTDPATVLPVQIYLWSDMPERGFLERTSAAIMVLLGFLVLMNAIAIFLRKKFERRW